MYNIDNHYQLVYDIAFDKNKHNVSHPVLLYLFPFGSTSIDNVECLHQHTIDNRPKFVIIAYDQEPLNFEFNQKLFNEITNLYFQSKFINHFDEIQVYSQSHQSYIHVVSSERYQSYIRPGSKSIGNKLSKNSIQYILLNTEKDSEEKTKILNHYNFIDCYYFFHALAAADWYRGNQYSQQIISPRQRQLEKKFITFNRITGDARVYRSFLLSELYQNNLLKHGHISYSKICPVHGDHVSSVLDAQKKYFIDAEYVQLVLQNLTHVSDNLRIDTPHSQMIDNGSYTVGPIDKINASFLYIVTETCYWEQKKHLTEKIFKPIASKMPFVLLGCAYNLKYLKEYGFKTFDRWWDESYDEIDDPIQRLKAVVQIVEHLCNLSTNQLEEMLIEMEEILEYNFNYFYSKEFIDKIFNELKCNLSDAIDRAISHS